MKAETGIEGLDELIGGGLPQGRVYLLNGSPGSGKTTFGMQYLIHGVSFGDAGLYVTLMQNSEHIIADISTYSLNLSALMKMKKIFFADLGPEMEYGYMDELKEVINPESNMNPYPVEGEPPSASTVFKEIAAHVAVNDIKRVVVDPLSSIRFSNQDKCLEKMEMARFLRNLQALGCTTLLIDDQPIPVSVSSEHFAADGVILFHNPASDDEDRSLQIIKMRGVPHPVSRQAFRFGEKGIEVLGRR
ncbi:RAD55 family ATPase [Methanohalophilus mahii]|uniref:RecA-superfamily ATPase implicated in signal transduction n=1 Tax=Methanohalophilus mahii (strain ATCC 35705 / DSM 5219 / SLP) TaxID=547558 RepID=D5E8P0_METMS|nr:ATPase domain-containing protein [Methanohalophilus mahii]ADE35549.1 RecA-superfamily ATPase implicated in signal transduction [Methanohalophilus mahii DSM 5219]